MKINCYLSPGCSSEDTLRANISRALENEQVEVEVNVHRIDDETACRLNLTGSPAVCISGKELQPLGVVGFSRRRFQDESGRLTDVPTVEMLQKAIREQKRRPSYS